MSTWYLVADIGGTNARFSALKPGQLESELQFFHSVDEYPNFENLLEIIINEIGQVTGWENPPYKACFAVACPPDADERLSTCLRTCRQQRSMIWVPPSLTGDCLLYTSDAADE